MITTLISDILEQFRQDVETEGENFYTYENVRLSFEYFSRYQKQVLDLHRFGYGSILLEMLNRFHEDITGAMPHKSMERYQIYIYIGSLYNTAMMWLQDGQREPIDEVSDMFYRACVSG